MAPKYQGIVRELSQRIAKMKQGDQLPTELALSEEFGVSPMTVRRALGILADAGRITAVRGRGTFVLRPGVTNRMEMVSFTQAVRSAGMVPSARVLGTSTAPATKDEAKELEIRVGDPVYHIQRLRFADGQPICIDDHLLIANRYPDLLNRDLTRSLNDVFTMHYNAVSASGVFRIAASLPTEWEADLLEIGESTPCLRVHVRRLDTAGDVKEATTSLYRGDLWELLTEQQF